MESRAKKGFTLIEIMIVVAIIGILAALAIPNYQSFQCRARQAEAKVLLSGLYTAEQAYFAQYSKFLTTETSVGFAPSGTPRTYKNRTITVSGPKNNQFTATTSGDPDGDGVFETWSINTEQKNPSVDANDCLR